MDSSDIYADGGCGCEGGAPQLAVTGGAGEAKKAAGALYSGTATFGKVMSTIGAVIGCIIAIILVLVGVAQLRSPRTTSATATITKVVSAAPNLVVNATFTDAAGKVVSLGSVSLGSQAMAVGQSFTVWYDPADPSDYSAGVSPRTFGWGLVVGGLVVAGVTVLVAVLAHKYKWFAALYGADQGISLIRDVV